MASNIVEIVCQVAREEQASRVLVIHLVIGELSCVAEDSLRFAFEVVARGTAAASASLSIEKRPVVVHCPACEEDLALESPQEFRCPRCGQFTGQLVSGRELEIDRIEVESKDASS